jgi:hypothetical protein
VHAKLVLITVFSRVWPADYTYKKVKFFLSEGVDIQGVKKPGRMLKVDEKMTILNGL